MEPDQPQLPDHEQMVAGLLAWYDECRRDLPWRRTKDPYAILVSEVMLQQTQVSTVIPYYLRFLQRFPNAKALAEASEEELLKLWQGLGYYRRARNLQAAAQQIVSAHGGRFPNTKDDIDALKGVGAYTGAAVASIALDLPYACVDGNITRVITRITAMDEDVQVLSTQKTIQKLASSWLPPRRPGDFNQAMMELGATVCRPKKPSCLTCPVQSFCKTQQLGQNPEARPVKSKKTKVSKIVHESIFLFSGKRFLLARRPEKGLMAGMWELPAQAKDTFIPWRDCFEESPAILHRTPKPFEHRFTHLHAFYHLEIYHHPAEPTWRKAPNAYAETRWVDQEDLSRLPLTKVFLNMLPHLTSFLEDPCRRQTSTLPGVQITS